MSCLSSIANFTTIPCAARPRRTMPGHVQTAHTPSSENTASCNRNRRSTGNRSQSPTSRRMKASAATWSSAAVIGTVVARRGPSSCFFRSLLTNWLSCCALHRQTRPAFFNASRIPLLVTAPPARMCMSRAYCSAVFQRQPPLGFCSFPCDPRSRTRRMGLLSSKQNCWQPRQASGLQDAFRERPDVVAPRSTKV